MNIKAIESMKTQMVEDASAFWKFSPDMDDRNFLESEAYIYYRRICCNKIGFKFSDKYVIDDGSFDEHIKNCANYSMLYKMFDAAMMFAWWSNFDCYSMS